MGLETQLESAKGASNVSPRREVEDKVKELAIATEVKNFKHLTAKLQTKIIAFIISVARWPFAVRKCSPSARTGMCQAKTLLWFSQDFPCFPNGQTLSAKLGEQKMLGRTKDDDGEYAEHKLSVELLRH